jgi:hypothetical protein
MAGRNATSRGVSRVERSWLVPLAANGAGLRADLKRLRIAADTSLGVLFTDAEAAGHGLIVTDRLVEAVAFAYDLPVSEVFELVSLEVDGERVELPPPPHHKAHRKALEPRERV